MAEAVWSGPLVVGGATGGGRLGRNVCLSNCELGYLISMGRLYVCIVPLRWPCTLFRRMDALHSNFGAAWLPRLWLQCIFIELIQLYLGILVMWYQHPLHSRVEFR